MRLKIISTKQASSPLITFQLLCGESRFKNCHCLKDSASGRVKLSQIKIIKGLSFPRFDHDDLRQCVSEERLSQKEGKKGRWNVDTARD